MSTYHFVIIISLCFFIGGVVGYILCYIRYKIWDLLKVIEITADIISEKITPEEALREMKKLDEE